MITGGKGGALTQTGLRFEERVSLKSVFEKAGFTIKDNFVLLDGREVAELYPKHNLYKGLLEKKDIDYKKIISKKLLPDDAIFVIKENTLYIIEIKFQHGSGSVDEKLQTCDFKNKQYLKLLSGTGIEVKYTYVLNDWFKKPEYADVLNYIHSVGCFYFFDVIPLTFFGLNK